MSTATAGVPTPRLPPAGSRLFRVVTPLLYLSVPNLRWSARRDRAQLRRLRFPAGVTGVVLLLPVVLPMVGRTKSWIMSTASRTSGRKTR